MTKETKKTSTPSKTKKPAEKPASPPAKVSEEMTKAKADEELKKVIPGPMQGHLFGRMLGVMRSRGADDTTQRQEDFAVWAFGGLKPENTAEALLCTQMIATWETGMGMLTAAKTATDFQSLTEHGSLAVKLLSIFERQFATLTKARKPPQTVTVVHEHKHVHVNAPRGTGDEIRIEGQAHATDPRTLALAPGPALLSQNAPRDTLPVARDTARPLPHARRRTRDRRT